MARTGTSGRGSEGNRAAGGANAGRDPAQGETHNLRQAGLGSGETHAAPLKRRGGDQEGEGGEAKGRRWNRNSRGCY